ncbi:HU family DNA-binding protein [Candidatus Aerophobetes bacterium]|uniref:HU family DNA-binding protein n=1 Tax=Aerophobetes bacterium TaxID=2030807 RepID=A0A523RXI3_UNCAE|nr:MAG: HU family DNA-binding protein [Candidatus Aerophobetes bacterium]
MNKADLVEKIADQTGLTKKTSREAVDAIISAITDSMSREEKVTLVGFGTFQVMERKARKGRNPQTRETINIPAKNVPKFRPGKGLREAVR